jgi:RND family efflux transporter MFP subunit
MDIAMIRRVLYFWAAVATLSLTASVVRAETLSVERRSIADEKAVFATAESISVVPARSRIGGTVAQLHVREGDAVTRGQAIAVVGDEKLVLQMKSLDAQMEALQAQADQAQTDFDRIEGLVERGTLPRTRLDEARTALNVAQNNLRARTAERGVIQQQQAEGRVLAPQDGRVLKRLVTVGSVVLPGDPVVTVAQQHFKLRLRLPEEHAGFLKTGDRIRLDGSEFGQGTAKWALSILSIPRSRKAASLRMQPSKGSASILSVIACGSGFPVARGRSSSFRRVS